jgi:hypothetical protein
MKPDPGRPKQSFVKAVSWETFSNLVCGWLAYDIFVKLILSYWHEQTWHQIQWRKSQ